MKKRTLLYIPLVFLFALSLTVLTLHANRVFSNLSRIIRTDLVRSPFLTRDGGAVSELRPEGETAGMQLGDRVLTVNGRDINADDVFYEELGKTRVGEPLNFTVERKTENGGSARQAISVPAARAEIPLRERVSDFAITLIFQFLLPVVSFLLGFYVAFVRPRDALAWILLFVLLGIGSVGMESGRRMGTLVFFFQESAMSFFGLAMLLFGIYFPERWSLDKRFPWAKWIFIIPLALNGILNLVEQIGRLFGWERLWKTVDDFTSPFDRATIVLTMIAISLFFAAMAMKSATLENKDSRRRLRILYAGTSIAMLPSLGIVLYRIFSGIEEAGFFELVPAWFAIFSLLVLLLFPLTMAYVIVVERAMDVSVVIRQGLQYALARNGIKVLQFFLILAVGLGTLWTINNFGSNISAQIAFIVGGVALIPLIDMIARRLRVWIDRKFFREAYNAEQILSDLSEDVRTMIETKPLLETVSSRISESLHVPQVALLLKNGGDFQPAYALGYKNAPNVSLNENDATIEKLKTNEPLVIYQDDQDSWINDEAQTAERENLRELNSQLLLPFGAKNELSGLISLSPKLSDSPYTPTDLRLLKSVAAQTGLALENSRLTQVIVSEAAQKERINRELEIAREVQERLFPQEFPRIEGLDYFGACRSALDVGGDYYDFIELPENKFGIAIGDISGKGIGASLMMASLQASLRGQAIHFKSDLAGLMKQINSLVYEASTSNRYATFFYAQYEPKTKKLTYVNAGHNPPFLIRKSGEVLRLEEGGAVIGMLPSMLVNYKQDEIKLRTGDLLVGYTDGISEAMNPQEEEWSEDAMLEELKKVYEKPAVEILPYIVACADEFASGAKQHDDMTMIVVKV
ncbi:MAG: SpoIIE family protein phosphatase, partial [Acidobacteriota bacterium]|nr:SpoIIE family protein phosphatase [Acidobacteriota bacterium]